ncbi:glycosyltransferase [Maribacter sp. 2307UL18-2]|uniref:glycosyltransferase n=1 Tax=Maribacter sp. 2307UL18-2 TaxID=3386274 RepID=UPI0039BD6F43
MKIDFLISKMTDGGAQRVISLIANYLDDKGHQIRIISFTGGDQYPLNEAVERVRLHEQPLIKSVVFSGFFSLLSFYKKKENRPDIMNSHIDLLGYMTIPVAKIYGIKIIVSEHNNHLSRYTYQEKFLWTFLYPMANAVTILTSFDLNYFSKKNKKVVVMPNPCSFEIAENLSSKRKKEIVAIGQLNRYHHKGFDNLIKIAKLVGDQKPDWLFKIIGAGDHGREILERMVEEADVTNIEFSGYRTDIKDILNKAEIFMLPSRFEGLPMTLLEACSQGAACIAYDCISGPSDILVNEESGLLIENQNIEAMVSGLLRLIDDNIFRAELQKNAPLALEKFSMSNVGDKWEYLLKEVRLK